MAVFAPLITLTCIFGISLLIWVAFQDWGLVPVVAAKAVLYLASVITSLIFTYRGERIVKRLLRWYNKEWDYTGALWFLHPNRIRLYVYGVMAVAYVLGNMETFSGQVIIPFAWWTNYRDIMIETLITTVTFDALFMLWREQKKGE
jgi:hypothetical protein